MNGWNRDGSGQVKVSPVLGWKTARPLSENANVFLRLEFGVGHDLESVSALQFSLTAEQARALSQQLADDADKHVSLPSPPQGQNLVK
ncbi:UNVERIFIED_ORG: hypothetical protein J2W85_007170 [Ensifer adhaerens]|nr:hypothetical protein [Ensifer adhaerens]